MGVNMGLPRPPVVAQPGSAASMPAIPAFRISLRPVWTLRMCSRSFFFMHEMWRTMVTIALRHSEGFDGNDQGKLSPGLGRRAVPARLLVRRGVGPRADRRQAAAAHDPEQAARP